MNAIKNKVQLIGYLGENPEISTLEDGQKQGSLSLGTNECYRNAQGVNVTETLWHRITLWGELAEIAEKYLAKGSEVAIDGKLVNRHYTDKQGIKRFVTEIHAHELLILTKRK